MPNFNRKGPCGTGPMTGRKMGKCNPENTDKTVDEMINNQGENAQKGQGLRRGLKQNGNRGFIARCRNVFGNSQQNGCGQGMGKRNRKNNIN